MIPKVGVKVTTTRLDDLTDMYSSIGLRRHTNPCKFRSFIVIYMYTVLIDMNHEVPSKGSRQQCGEAAWVAWAALPVTSARWPPRAV